MLRHCDVTDRRAQDNCDVTTTTSSATKSRRGHMTAGGVVSDVVANNMADEKDERSLLIGCVDDVTSLRAPVSKNIKVFVCSTGTGYTPLTCDVRFIVM